jgi:hypothetical protein
MIGRPVPNSPCNDVAPGRSAPAIGRARSAWVHKRRDGHRDDAAPDIEGQADANETSVTAIGSMPAKGSSKSLNAVVAQ